MTHEFCDHCEGCRPALIDSETGKVYAQDSPLMLEINRIWNKETTYAERKAFIDVTLRNASDAESFRLAASVAAKFSGAKL